MSFLTRIGRFRLARVVELQAAVDAVIDGVTAAGAEMIQQTAAVKPLDAIELFQRAQTSRLTSRTTDLIVHEKADLYCSVIAGPSCVMRTEICFSSRNRSCKVVLRRTSSTTTCSDFHNERTEQSTPLCVHVSIWPA